MTQPPRIAMWILKHFGSGPDNDTLLGDLAEQYQRNGSAMWYWRQVMKAIPISLFKEIRGHKWIAGRALLTGWAVWIAFVRIMPPISLGIAVSSFKEIGGHKWVGNRAVLSFHDALYGPLLVGIVCGWLVAHLHRNHRTAVVLLFAATVILQYMFGLQPLAFYGLMPYLHRPSSVNFAAEVIASLLGILLGGGLLLDKSKTVTN